MNKAELIAAVAAKTEHSKKMTEEAVNAILAVIAETVAKRDAVQIIGFGTFKTATRAARTGRNPQTGAALKIAEATLPKFTPGATFKKQVAEGGQKGKTSKAKKTKK
jgi:DNA-binding protein HU-beta